MAVKPTTWSRLRWSTTQRLVGTITVDDVIDALVQGQTEDVHKFGGLQALESALPEHRSLDDDPEAGRLAVKGNGRIWSG